MRITRMDPHALWNLLRELAGDFRGLVELEIADTQQAPDTIVII